MPPVTYTAEQESSFLSGLISGLDDSFFNAVPSPDPTPVKKRRRTASLSPRKNITSLQICSGDVNMDSLVEGAENWDWDDMEADFLTPKKATNKKKEEPLKPKVEVVRAPKYVRETCTRCVVESVAESSEGRFHKNLIVQLDPGEEKRIVILRDDWAATDIRAGDTINVLGDFTLDSETRLSTISITSKFNTLIQHPDLLLTATALSNAPQCRRKPLLSNLIRSGSDSSPALVWGNVLHEVMQSCLSTGNWDEAWINTKIDEVLSANLVELFKIEVGIEQAQREIKLRAKGLTAFSRKYMGDLPKNDAILTDTRSTKVEPSLLAVSELHDVEEDIWSPTYGLKGKLDATVQAIISEPNPNSVFSKMRVLTSGPRPFEIKTGRAIAGMEHRAQTMLYTLLAAERYGVEVPSGLLYYTQSEEVVRVPAGRNELRGLITARNEMAGFMVARHRKSRQGYRQSHVEVEGGQAEGGESVEEEEPFLPATIDDERTCKRCYALDACMLYRKTVENVIDTDSPIADIYDMKTAHLTPDQCTFFKKWEALISLEEQDLVRFKKELWTMGAAQRESKGRCFGSMVLDANYVPPALPAAKSKDTKIHHYTYRFTRSAKEASSLLNGHMTVGDAITVSVEPNLLALARGFIVHLTPYEIVVGVDHDLSVRTIATRLSAFTAKTPTSTEEDKLNIEAMAQVIFRIDKDELFGGMGRIRDNLARLFYADGDTRRLELVVDLKPPRFDTTDLTIPPALQRHSTHLNESQKQAMAKVLSTQDYSLILGMPGTGKTTVIAAIIKTLVEMGKTVLLTSYTHSAVDTILLKLKEGADFGILRLGNVDKVHPDVQEFTLGMKKKATTLEQLEMQLMAPPVVATTCLSIDHALFARRTFDYCIIDEASQITLPTCVGPLRFADKFVLVGDHFQLPPLVRNPEARKGGLDVSLFRRLSDAHPAAVVDLTHQYRMNEDIMLLSNRLIYDDRLRCGSADVANRSLVLPNRSYLADIHGGNAACKDEMCWLSDVLAESCKAVFLDTDLMSARESRMGDLPENQTEARLVHQIIDALIQSGVPQDELGVISLYRQQTKLLSHLLQDRKQVEILTADRSQGRDKDCIIISLVRSNEHGQVGELVKDWRRMNVSFTRARSKLIIIGSRTTLQAAPILSEFFSLMESQSWIVKLPATADMLHPAHPRLSSTPNKRVASGDSDQGKSVLVKENSASPARSPKRLRRLVAEGGVLKGRPLLQDVLNGDQ